MAQKTFHPTRNIVLAIDGSEHANAATKLIRNLPLPETCKISVISVLLPRNAQYHAALEHLLEQTQILLQSEGRAVEAHLLTGYPAEQIIQFSAEHKPDLLVLGAKGLRGTLRILLGGVAQKVVEYAKCPVLIVRAPHTAAKRVLLVSDGSEHSQWAIQHIEECPLPTDAEVTVMHVLPPEMTSDMLLRSWPYGLEVLPAIPPTDFDESLDNRAKEEEQRGQELLDQALEHLSESGIAAKSVLQRGDTATEILNYAQEHESDLIVAGSRGLGQVQSWLLGSVSNKLTHYADCSVLIVKQRPAT